MESKSEVIKYLDSASLFILGILFIGFPILVTSLTTDPFGLPKQILLAAVVLVLLVFQGLKMVLEKTIRIRRTPFDLTVIAFTIIVFISTLLAVNRLDAIIAFIPLLLVVLLYFIVVNTIKDHNSLLFLHTSLIGGAVLISILAVLSLFKIYVLPFDFAKIDIFSPIGSLLDQAIYLALVLPIAAYPLLKRGSTQSSDLKDIKGGRITLGVGTAAIAIGLAVTIYNLIAKQNPIILPYEAGFQTAFAAISQDAGRIAQGFFFGSGFGTYGADFTRFKQPSFNLNQALWSISFFRSSSFVLELLATTGVLGLASFVFLVYKIVKEKPVFIPLILGVVGLFLLPFSFINQVLFFILLAVYAASQGLKHSKKYFDIELQLVALKKGLIAFETPAQESRERSGILSIIVFVAILALVGFLGYSSGRYALANVYFQRSLVAASQNNGTLTYQNQVKAISTFGEIDAYQRIFSQTNLALANSLAAQLPKDSSPSAQTTQTIYTLIQQAINAGRTAGTIAPQTSLNWQNLSSIYRSLIGFGQNADQFAVLTAQQAIALDPNNPQGYITLGGIYYQLGAWDLAIQQFQTAVSLKPDLANAYYNLGHALEQKGDLKGALTQYQAVKSLITNDKPNLEKINAEINALQSRINGQAAAGGETTPSDKLEVSTPSAQLPPQNPPVKIPAPKTTITPAPTQGVTPAPTTTIPQ